MTELILISICHAIICVLSLIVIHLSVRSNGLGAITSGALTFVYVSTLGLTFSHYVDYGVALPFSDDSSMVVYRKQPFIYLNQVISHWIFLLLILLTLRLNHRKIVWGRIRPIKINRRLLKVGLLSFVAFAYIRYFLFGPGLETALTTSLTYLSAEDAVMARTLAKDNFYGQGVYSASVAAYIVLPVLFAAYIIKGFEGAIKQSKVRYAATFALYFALSFLYAYQTRQKAPMIQVVLVYALLHFCKKINDRRLLGNYQKVGIRRIMNGGLALFGLSVGLYVLVFNMGVTESIFATVVRIFMVPSATEANYFYVFPDLLDYRGVLESFVIRIFYPPGESGVSIYDVAVAATGIQFTANASFIAVGWSGLGYVGVFLVAAAVCLSLLLTESILADKSAVIKQLALALNATPLLILNSGSFLEYIGAGGLFAPMIFILLVTKRTPTPILLDASDQAPSYVRR